MTALFCWRKFNNRSYENFAHVLERTLQRISMHSAVYVDIRVKIEKAESTEYAQSKLRITVHLLLAHTVLLERFHRTVVSPYRLDSVV